MSLWYKGIYIKYLRKNKPDGSKDLNYSDSILSFANSSFEEKEIWRKMAECVRAWAYANDLDINLVIVIETIKAIIKNNIKLINTTSLSDSKTI